MLLLLVFVSVWPGSLGRWVVLLVGLHSPLFTSFIACICQSLCITIPLESFADGNALRRWCWVAECTDDPTLVYGKGLWCPISKDVTTRVEHCKYACCVRPSDPYLLLEVVVS
jgi:hypothetical protein